MSLKTQAITPRSHWLAIRVACCNCGSKEFNFLGRNEVECVKCNTRQWFSLTLDQDHKEAISQSEEPGLFKRIKIALGFPQPAFIGAIPKATQFFWFKCSSCKKTTIDYLHGYSRYLICQFCRSKQSATVTP